MTSFEYFPWFVNFIRVWNCHVGIDTKNFGIPGAMLVLEVSICYNKVLEELPLRKK